MSAKNLSIAALALIAAAVPSRADDVGMLKFVNGTSAIIRFYVDGSPSCAADPGSYCNDSTSVGNHTLYSRYEDPNYTQATACDSQNVYVPPGGFTWTCS